MVKLPIFSDQALQRLTMPVLAILGGKDVLLDSAETKERLERNVPHVEIRYHPEAGHFIPGQTAPILEFLRKSLVPANPRSSAQSLESAHRRRCSRWICPRRSFGLR